MPVKKGPNNTLRYYSSTNGRYTSSPFSLPTLTPPKKTNEERIKIKYEMLYNRAKKVKDKYLFDLFLFIENQLPGSVTLVNDRVYHKSIGSTREIDLMTKTSIIEVKSGKVRHKSSQFIAQQNLAKELNKKHVVYAPDISDKKLVELKNKGIDVVRNKNDLLERIKK